VQHHVKELSRLNQSLEGFLQDCASLDNLADFKASFMALKDCVAELSDTKKEFSTNMHAVAKHAATKVVTAWKAEVQTQAEQQHELSSANNARWMGIETRIDELYRTLQEMADGIRGQTNRLEALEASQRRLHGQFSSLLGQSVEDIREFSGKLMDQVCSTFKQSAAANFEAFQAHMADLLLGDSGMGGLLESLDRRMSRWESTANTELAQHRESAEKLREQTRRLEDTAETARKRQASEQAAHMEKAESLHSQIRELQDELGRVKQSLQMAQDTSMSQCLLRLKDMDTRGHVKVNRQSGAVRLGTPLDFMPCNPPHTPMPEFADPVTADKVILDMAELLKIFNRPIVVDVLLKPGKGGNPEFWEEAAEAQAELLRSRLKGLGVASNQLIMRGMTAGKAPPGVLIKLDQSLFAEQVEDKEKVGKGKSPTRKAK